MEIKIEEKDYRDRLEIAKQILREAKLNLLMWTPIAENCEKEIAKCKATQKKPHQDKN